MNNSKKVSTAKLLGFWLLIVYLVAPVCSGLAQEADPLLETFKKNFEKAESVEIKIKVIEDAISSGAPGLESLYHSAVDYVFDSTSQAGGDTDLKQLVLTASEQLKKVGYKDSRNSLWRLFQVYTDPIVQIGILDALTVVGQGDVQISRGISDWLSAQNSLFAAGELPDFRVISSAVVTLGSLKNAVAFPVLFTVKDLGYSKDVSDLALQALLSLEGDLLENLAKVITGGTPKEKLSALNLGLESPDLGLVDKAALAETGLEVGLYTSSPDYAERQAILEIRQVASNALGERKWSQASELVMEHLGLTLLEFDRGVVTKGYALDAINALGSMGTHEAAERLSLHLELLNSYTEYSKVYDEQIVLSVLLNLRELGDKIAFPTLSYTQYLNYSDTIKKAAKDAIDNLKW